MIFLSLLGTRSYFHERGKRSQHTDPVAGELSTWVVAHEAADQRGQAIGLVDLHETSRILDQLQACIRNLGGQALGVAEFKDPVLGGTLIRFEDNTWHREFSGVRSDLHALASSGGAFYAVGSNGSILHNADGIWEPEHSGCDNTLQAVAATSTAVYAVGSGGVILKRQT